MFNKIKKRIISIIGYTNYRKFLISIMRRINGVNKKTLCSSDIESAEVYAIEGKDTFFGYYDLCALSQDGSKLLSIVIDDEISEVGYFDTKDKKFYKLAESKAWNWQMGNRLRWVKNENAVMFNDFDDNKFISRVVDLHGYEVARFPFPVFDMDTESKTAYFTDFTILNYLRKGYGYSNIQVDFDNYYKHANNGLFSGNFETGEIKQIFSVDQLKNIHPSNSMNVKYHYINHITVNSVNGDIMFFHLWTDDVQSWKNRMVFLNKQGEIIKIIDDFDRASHYCWLDESGILVTVVTNNKTEYRLYNYRSGNYELIDGIHTDGHPSFCQNSRFFITDTYPNRCGMQSVYICDSQIHGYKNLFSVFHNPSKIGDMRCDLHPRLMGSFINIDSVSDETRKQYLLKVHFETRDSQQWLKTLSLENQAQTWNDESDCARFCSCLKAEYLYMTKRNHFDFLKAMYIYIIDPTFRVNVQICRMQRLNKLSKKRSIRSRLERKYSIVVDQHCEIGKHFRTDHFVGIVIGPGVKIGKYTKIYQNVTLGQKDGKFPVIGDHVIIYPGAVIIGGVSVGSYSIIGANAVVTKDVPEGAVVAGVPAKILRIVE